MATWYAGAGRTAADPQRIATDLDDYGAHCTAVLHFMPGITSAQLLLDDGTAIKVKTNEGTMERTNIRKQVHGDSVILEFDEVYHAGAKFVASSHHRHEFTASEDGSVHRLTIRDMQANGFLGWMYRRFASRNIGNGLLKSYEAYYQADQTASARTR